MKILIGTPAAGGMVTTRYLESMVGTLMGQDKIMANHRAKTKGKDQPYEIGFYTLANESLIGRGRNHCAQVAIDGGWDKLFFIDADVGWTWPQFKQVVDNCDSSRGQGISAGACPLKTYPLVLNFLPFEKDHRFFELYDSMKTPEGMCAMNRESETALIEIPMIGTAFMCIDVTVLKQMKDSRPYYVYPNPMTGVPLPHWDFFPSGPINNKFVSEDWGFCHYAREQGHKVWLNTDVCVNHTGQHTFQADLKAIHEAMDLKETDKILQPNGDHEQRASL